MDRPLLNTLPTATYAANNNSDAQNANDDALIAEQSPQATGAATTRAKKSQQAEAEAAVAAAQTTRNVDGVGAVSSAGHSTPNTGGVTQRGPNLPDVVGDKASLGAVQLAIGNYVASPSAGATDTADVAASAASTTAPVSDAATSTSAASTNRSLGGLLSAGALDANPNADISIAAMYTILQSVITSAQKLAGNIKRNAQKASINAKQAAVADTLDKLAADKKDAGFQLGASLIGAGLSIGMAFKGSDLQNRGREAAGAMLSAFSRPINDLITQGYSTLSINSGYQLQSREAEIAQKNEDVTAQINQNTVESSKGAWDQTTEFIRNLNQSFLTMVQNHKSAIDNTAQR